MIRDVLLASAPCAAFVAAWCFREWLDRDRGRCMPKTEQTLDELLEALIAKLQRRHNEEDRRLSETLRDAIQGAADAMSDQVGRERSRANRWKCRAEDLREIAIRGAEASAAIKGQIEALESHDPDEDPKTP